MSVENQAGFASQGEEARLAAVRTRLDCELFGFHEKLNIMI